MNCADRNGERYRKSPVSVTKRLGNIVINEGFTVLLCALCGEDSLRYNKLRA